MFRKNKNFVILEIYNSCDIEPYSINGNLISSKKQRNQHGIGIKSIKRVVNKYNGEFSWSYDKINRQFKTLIVLFDKKD